MGTFWLVMQLCSAMKSGDLVCNDHNLIAKDKVTCERYLKWYTQGTMTKVVKKIYEGEKPVGDQMGIKDMPVCVTDQEMKARLSK
jgi:hypothetical protein